MGAGRCDRVVQLKRNRRRGWPAAAEGWNQRGRAPSRAFTHTAKNTSLPWSCAGCGCAGECGLSPGEGCQGCGTGLFAHRTGSTDMAGLSTGAGGVALTSLSQLLQIPYISCWHLW